MKLLFLYTLTKILARPRCICQEEPFDVPVEIGFQANDFVCIDNTSYRHFISRTEFVVKKCSTPGSCFTRVPPNKNPCIGKELAQQIDG